VIYKDMFWPVHIAISFPCLVVNVKCNRNITDIISGKSAPDVGMVCSKVIFSRMRLDHLQSILSIFLLQAPHGRYSPKTKDACICPTINEDDLTLQAFDRQWLRVSPICYFFEFRGRSRRDKFHFYIQQKIRQDITVRCPLFSSAM
jgi:hypothetical protein